MRHEVWSVSSPSDDFCHQIIFPSRSFVMDMRILVVFLCTLDLTKTRAVNKKRTELIGKIAQITRLTNENIFNFVLSLIWIPSFKGSKLGLFLSYMVFEFEAEYFKILWRAWSIGFCDLGLLNKWLVYLVPTALSDTCITISSQVMNTCHEPNSCRSTYETIAFQCQISALWIMYRLTQTDKALVFSLCHV